MRSSVFTLYLFSITLRKSTTALSGNEINMTTDSLMVTQGEVSRPRKTGLKDHAQTLLSAGTSVQQTEGSFKQVVPKVLSNRS